MNDDCECCDGTKSLTPEPIANRPGLPMLVRRIGTHSSFYESMKARLSSLPWDSESPLRNLTTRDPSDPSLALLDAWSTVADVLTFYQERIANEGYLRTAAERRSILELSRLVGYKPRPGVAASVHLAFTLDDDSGEILTPAGTGAKSIPGQNETPQTFETSNDLKARSEWNELRPRLTRPTRITVDTALNLRKIYLQGISLHLSPNDYLILRIGVTRRPVLRKVERITEDFAEKRTIVELQADTLSREPFVGDVSLAIQAFLDKPRFPATPPLVQTVYDDLGKFINSELALDQTLQVLEKKVHGLITGARLDSPQTWSEKLRDAFTDLAGAPGKPLSDLHAVLTTALNEQLTGAGPTFKSSCVAIADEYSKLETALTGLKGTLSGSGRDAAREKATKISHEVQRFTARIEHDRGLVITPAAAPLEYDTTSGTPSTIDRALHLSRLDDSDPSSASYLAQVQISANLVSGADVLEFAGTASVKLDAAGSTSDTLILVPDLTGAGVATLAEFEDALRQVTFKTTAAAGKNRRVVSFTMLDAGTAKAIGLKSIVIDSDLSGHSLATTFVPLRYRSGASTPIDDNVAIDDPAVATGTTSVQYVATIRIEANLVNTEDQLEFADTAKIEHTAVDERTLRLGVKAGQTASFDDFQDALRSVTYTNSAVSPTSATRTITISLRANAGASAFEAVAQRDIDIRTSDLDILIDGITGLRSNIESNSQTFGQSSPPSPSITSLYTLLKNSITDFEALTFDSTIDDAVQAILDRLKLDIAKPLLSEQAKVVEDVLPPLLTQATSAASAATPLPVLADKIRKTVEQLKAALSDSGTEITGRAQSATTAYGTAVGLIVAGLSSAGTQVVGEFKRFLAVVNGITNTLPPTGGGASLSGCATAVENAISNLAAAESNAGKLQLGFTRLLDDVRNLRVQLWRFCHRMREGFQRRIEDRIDRSLPLFEGMPTGLPDLHKKLADLDSVVDHVDIGTAPLPGDLPKFGNPLEELVKPVKLELDRDPSPAPASPTLGQILRDNAVNLGQFAEPLRTVLEELELAVGQIAGSVTGSAPQQTQPIMPDITGLLRQFARPILDPAGRQRLLHDFQRVFSSRSDTLAQLQQALDPSLRDILYEVWRSLSVELGEPRPQVYVLRKRMSLFGYNAPQAMSPTTDVIGRLKTGIAGVTGLSPAQNRSIDDNIDRILASSAIVILTEPSVITSSHPFPEAGSSLYLDNVVDKILPESQVVIDQPGEDPEVRTVSSVATHPRTAYGISGTTTELSLREPWWVPASDGFDVIRGAAVHVQSEELQLGEEPDTRDVGNGSALTVDGLLEGIGAGRKLILSGERTDIVARGIRSTELIEVIGVDQDIDLTLPGDTIHSRLSLAEPLQHSYRRETVTIHGNVIAATQGETQREILGSGDAKQTFQRFSLSSSPLTFLPVPTAAGAQSTLTVRVNNVVWNGSDDFSGMTSTDRIYVTTTDDEEKTTVTFGDGIHGARLPTGTENVEAIYRTGLGRSGSVTAGQISQLSQKPLGVRDVLNPLRASGGADRETRDLARRNAPMAVMSLDRLVSIQDYADFARTFAGIGKATAIRLSDGRQNLVHITIAGAGDIPIDPGSALFANLLAALQRNGDPHRPIQLQVRELALLVIDAGVRIGPAHQWNTVERDIRAAVLDKFSFDRREPGQDVAYGEVVDTIQKVAGVVSVDINVLDSVPETITAEELRGLSCRLALNPRVPVSHARTSTTFRRRFNADCPIADFIAAYALKSINDVANPDSDKSALKVLQDLNPGLLDLVTEADLADSGKKTFRQLIAEGKLNPANTEFLTVRSRETGIRPAQLAYLGDVPGTFLLAEIQ